MANLITLFRILLVPVFVMAMVYDPDHSGWKHWLPLFIFSLACLTDALDGYIARVRHERSIFGEVLDPIADKLLLISAFLCIFYSSRFSLKPPAWIMIIIISRDVFIIAGLMIIFLTTGKLRVRPTLLGKATTLAQMLSVISLLATLPSAPVLWNIAGFLTVISGFDYLKREVNQIRSYAFR